MSEEDAEKKEHKIYVYINSTTVSSISASSNTTISEITTEFSRKIAAKVEELDKSHEQRDAE
jgi:hypothetical protein